MSLACCCCVTPPEEEIQASRRRKRKGGTDGTAPGRLSMKDRNEDMDEDTRAVAKWRDRKSLEKAGGLSPTNPLDERTNSLNNSKSRMEQRNPLEKPYDIVREMPLNPKDGSILQPPVKTPTKNVPSPASPPATSSATQAPLAVFHPHVEQSTSHSSLERQQPANPSAVATDDVLEMNIVSASEQSPESKLEKKLGKWSKKKAARQSKRAKEASSGELVQGGGLTFPERTPKILSSPEHDNSDHLSDVPSDVDSITRERYLLACQMLKKTLIQKEKSLIPIEREYILGLLEDYEQATDGGGSVVSEDQVSMIESAILRLDKDPLFSPSRADAAPSPLTAANMAGSKRKAESKQNPRTIPKNPHTATKPAKLSLAAFNPCSPDSAEEAGVKADIVHVVPEEEEANEDAQSELIRFDGWSFHKKGDHAPFTILGADDASVQPRVLTPSIMEALRGFFPYSISESNFWLKFSLIRDGTSLATLLNAVRASNYTIIGVETTHGDVFGSFTGSPWRTGTKWFGSGEAFLWRLKKSRLTSVRNSALQDFENEMEVYPYTGYDDLVQYCTSKTIAVGGGTWLNLPCPFDDEPLGIGFMIDGDLAGGETNSCATFANPRLSKRVSTSNEFTISNLEVWTLTPCLNVKDAEKLELQKFFVEQHRR